MSTLVGGVCSICCHMVLVLLAFMHLYSILNLQLFLSIPFSNFLKYGIETPDRNGQWYEHFLTLFAIFYKSSTERTMDYVCMFYVYVMCMFCVRDFNV